MKESLKGDIQNLKDEMIAVRRDFHRYPEPGFKEDRTAEKIEQYLEPLPLELRKGVAGTGVVGLLRGKGEGKTILLRADMDALTIQEQNEFEYKSRHEGVMHACGHDGHMTILLFTAKILSRYRDRLKGNVKFIFQPAEEAPGGAKPMIEQGVLSDPRVDMALGLHLWNYLPLGKAGIRPGPVMAGMDRFNIKIIGKGGHGAMPHEAVDAIVMTGQIIMALQSIASRETPPLQAVVVTLGTIHGGYGFNIIADRVEIEGTTRALNSRLQATLPQRIERILGGITSALRGNYELNYESLYPVLVNDEKASQFVREICSSILGSDNVVVAEQTMGGEDMAFYLQKVPGCFFFLGAANPEKGLTLPHHHPRFDFDEDALPLGVEIFSSAVLKYLQ